MILSLSIWIALVVLCLAFLLTVWRVIKGPTLPDRVVALDMLVGIVIGFIALIAIRTGFTLYIDIAISLSLVGFLATVAFARFVLAGRGEQDEPDAESHPAIVIAPHQERRKHHRRDKTEGANATRRRKGG
jgi:multicomponent Na+:H+ antiporter subunit F